MRPKDVRPLAGLCALYGATLQRREGRLALVWCDPPGIAYAPEAPLKATAAPRKAPRVVSQPSAVKQCAARSPRASRA